MCTIIITGIFSLLGVALGGIINSRATIRANQDFTRREASNNLRAAFAPYLAAIRYDKDKSAVEIQSILETGINDLTIEMEKFRFFISSENLSAYDDACKEYQDIARIRAMNYESFGGKYPFKVFEKRVYDIFHFSNL